MSQLEIFHEDEHRVMSLILSRLFAGKMTMSERRKNARKNTEDKECFVYLPKKKNHNHTHTLTSGYLHACARTHIHTNRKHFAHEKSTPNFTKERQR